MRNRELRQELGALVRQTRAAQSLFENDALCATIELEAQLLKVCDLVETQVPATRHRDPETSHAAADSVKPSLRESQLMVLGQLAANGPSTHLELWRHLKDLGIKISASGLRTRVSELVDLGLVRDTGERRKLPSGRQSIIWWVTE